MDEKRDVFISYHTDSAGDIVHKLAVALESARISCWYAPRDCSDDYARSIVRAIRYCRVFLLVLNSKSNLSEHCFNEVNIAFERFKNHEDISLLPFQIEQCQLSDDMYYFLGRIHIMNGGIPPELLKVRELVDRVSRLLGKEQFVELTSTPALSGETIFPVKNYRLITSLVYPDTKFVGRRNELSYIKEQLSGTYNKLFLVGMGGLGKSELAKMYVKENAERYNAVLWVPFEGSLAHTLASDSAFPIDGIQRTEFTADSDEAYGRRKIELMKRIADHRILIVVDNFDVDGDPDLDLFLSGTYSVIFTTRIHQGCAHREMEVQPMQNDEELLAVFRSEYTRAMGPVDTEIVRKLITLLDRHTLSIRLVASAMQSRRIKPEKMLELLRDDRLHNLRENEKLADQIFGRLRAVFRLSTLSAEEVRLLKNLSLISNVGIHVETFYKWCGFEDYDLIDSLIARSWIIHDEVQDTVHLHPLIADLMLEELEKDSECCHRMVTSFYETYKWGPQLPVMERFRIKEIADTMCRRLPKNHPLYWNALIIKIGRVYDLSLYKQVFDDCKKLIVEAPLRYQKLYGYDKLAHGLILIGRNQEGLVVAEEGAALTKDVPIEDIDRFEGDLMQHNAGRIVEANYSLGNYEAAYAQELKNHALCSVFYSCTPEQAMGWSEYHLSKILYLLGRYDEAIEMIQQGIAHFNMFHDDYSRSFSYEIYAVLLAREGKIEDALHYSQVARETLLPLLGPDHIDIAKDWHFRSKIWEYAQNADKAIECLKKAVVIYRKTDSEIYINAAEARIKALEQRVFGTPSVNLD
ncbi:MAG: TIR domain-containing protein [Synergistaceae bacterium]|nr:TIR domain-containing protein [Synergistaceae bacterium]